MIYLDQAATTWPKPETVYHAVSETMRECGASPGRGSYHRSMAAGAIISDARMLCAKLFHAERPECICFTLNTTEALNLAIKGVLKPGDHVITSSMEHNSVSRPLKKIEAMGVSTTKVRTSPVSGMDPEAVKQALQSNTRLVICSHVSNVTGAISPIREIGAICRENGVLFLVDAAQSAGMMHIDVERDHIDLMAFPGHKGLLGPQGTGGLYIKDGLRLETLSEGGTGTQSERYDQPEEKPERYESGTPNLPGLAGLAAGIRFLLEEGPETVWKREAGLTRMLAEGLAKISGITVWGPDPGSPRGNVVSLTFDSINPGDAAQILDSEFDIAVRAGLHCARDAHETLGTMGSGGVLRVSPGPFNTEHEIETFLKAVEWISREID